jgi:hypothetical protein
LLLICYDRKIKKGDFGRYLLESVGFKSHPGATLKMEVRYAEHKRYRVVGKDLGMAEEGSS